MIHNIKYRSLKAFLLAVETGSFTHAADRLGVTQPSFTALIQDLEKVLDLRLFERTTRSIMLTAAGEDLVERVARPIADLEEAYRSMSDLAAARRGGVVVGALPSTSLTLVPLALGRLSRVHPALQIRIVEAHNDQLLSMLRTNQIELALATLLAETADLSFIPLIDDVFYAVYLRGAAIETLPELRWQDLVSQDLILLSQGSSARMQFDRSVKHDGIMQGLRYDVTHMTTAALLVRQGLGVAILPRLALPSLPLDGLAYRPVSDASARRTIGVIYRRDRHLSPAAKALVAELEKEAVTVARNLETLS